MSVDPTSPLFEDSSEPSLERLVALIQKEARTLLDDALPQALARQWSASPVPKPREDTPQRASGDRSDPTADVVLDARRLAVRDTVRRSEDALRDALLRLHGVRRAMEAAVLRYDGSEA